MRDSSEIISMMLRDNTTMMVTVSGVDVTDDLKYAKIFYTVLSENEEVLDKVKSIFDKSTGYIQSELAKRLRIRRLPEISLHYDQSLIEGLRVSALIDEVISKQNKKDD